MRTLLLVFGVFSLYATAQTLGEPFTLLRILRQPPGARSDSAPIQAHRKARANVDVLGLRSITGPPQVWLVESHGSFASIEALDRTLAALPDAIAADDELLGTSTNMVAIYRPGLSYRPSEAVRLLQSARYFQISVFRTRPGTEPDFAEMIRIRRFAQDSINLDRPELGYHIVSGALNGMFVFLAPLQSLAVIDNVMARSPLYADGAVKASRQIASEADVTREHLIFRVEPGISYVSESFASGDPEFWHGRAARH